MAQAEERVLELEDGAVVRYKLLWDLGEIGHRLAGQYYVEVEGKFLMDDVPSEKRTQLRRVLEAYGKDKASF